MKHRTPFDILSWFEWKSLSTSYLNSSIHIMTEWSQNRAWDMKHAVSGHSRFLHHHCQKQRTCEKAHQWSVSDHLSPKFYCQDKKTWAVKLSTTVDQFRVSGKRCTVAWNMILGCIHLGHSIIQLKHVCGRTQSATTLPICQCPNFMEDRSWWSVPFYLRHLHDQKRLE